MLVLRHFAFVARTDQVRKTGASKRRVLADIVTLYDYTLFTRFMKSICSWATSLCTASWRDVEAASGGKACIALEGVQRSMEAFYCSFGRTRCILAT